MKKSILVGISRFLLPVPVPVWRSLLRRRARKARAACAADLSHDHHRIRDFVVAEIGRSGQPQSPERIAAELGLAIERVRSLIAELERGMIYLYREGGEDVVWAYPATAAVTPFRLADDPGRRGFAA